MITFQTNADCMALYKALYEVKFNPNVQDAALITSPFIAELITLLYDKIENDSSFGNGWQSFRHLDFDRIEVIFAINFIKSELIDIWLKLDVVEKNDLLFIILAPFKFSESIFKHINDAI